MVLIKIMIYFAIRNLDRRAILAHATHKKVIRKYLLQMLQIQAKKVVTSSHAQAKTLGDM